MRYFFPGVSLQFVGDQSEYVSQIALALKERVPIVRLNCKASKHFRTFCMKFAEYVARAAPDESGRSLLRMDGDVSVRVSSPKSHVARPSAPIFIRRAPSEPSPCPTYRARSCTV